MTENPICFWKGYHWARNNSLIRQYPRFLFLPTVAESTERSSSVDEMFSLTETEISPDIVAAIIDRADYRGKCALIDRFSSLLMTEIFKSV